MIVGEGVVLVIEDAVASSFVVVAVMVDATSTHR